MSELRSFTFNHGEVGDELKADLAKNAFDKIQESFFDYPELDKLKSEVEWDVFWKIVEEIAVKSGVDPKVLNRVSPKTITGIKDAKSHGISLEGESIAGLYNFSLNFIGIDYSTVKNDAERYGLNEKIHALLLIFHEYVHSFSAVTWNGQAMESGPFSVEVVETSLGYERIKNITTKTGSREEQLKPEKNFWYLNEAVTDGLAYDIFNEYAQRTGGFSKSDIDSYQKALIKSNISDYPYIVGSIKIMCGIVAKRVGVDRATVWNSLVRGIFDNGTIETDEMKKYFSETFDNKFLPRLSQIKKVEDMAGFISDYKIDSK